MLEEVGRMGVGVWDLRRRPIGLGVLVERRREQESWFVDLNVGAVFERLRSRSDFALCCHYSERVLTLEMLALTLFCMFTSFLSIN